ncbi:Peregrin [Dictyocoela muelleri]|nr:Peregrin [Dictyocoela muelleri]
MENIPREEQNYKKLYPSLNPKQELEIKSNLLFQKQPSLHKRDFNTIEYNMDSADRAFLKTINMEHINPLIFELIMDRLEKEWYWLRQCLVNTYNVPFKTTEMNCNICGLEMSIPNNQLIYCDGCNICVHQECYGVPYVPENAWFCKKCLFCDEIEPQCKFCTERGGAYKQTTDQKWAHVLCCLYNENLTFGNAVFLEPIEDPENKNLSTLKKPRCIVCKQSKGLTINCKVENCTNFYHVTCAVQNSFYMDRANFITYCQIHDPRNKFKTLLNELRNEEDEVTQNDDNDNKLNNCKSINKNNCKSINKKGINSINKNDLNIVDLKNNFGINSINEEIKYPTLKEIPKPRNDVKLTRLQISYILKMKNAKPKPLTFFVDRILCNDLCKFNFENKIQFVKDVVSYWCIKKRKLRLNLELNLNKKDGIEWFDERSYSCIPDYNEINDNDNKDNSNNNNIKDTNNININIKNTNNININIKDTNNNNINNNNINIKDTNNNNINIKDTNNNNINNNNINIKDTNNNNMNIKDTNNNDELPLINQKRLNHHQSSSRKDLKIKEYLHFINELKIKCRHKKIKNPDTDLVFMLKPLINMRKLVYQYLRLVHKRKVYRELIFKIHTFIYNRELFVMKEIMENLISYRKFSIFYFPVDGSIVSGYFVVIKKPMDFFTINNKIKRYSEKIKNEILKSNEQTDSEKYTLNEFYDDLFLIVNNCREFNKGVSSLLRIATELNNKILENKSYFDDVLND